MPQLVQHVAEAGGPRNADGRPERQRRADPDQQRVLGRAPIQMWQRP
jgi:hypothetical protein